MLNYNLKTRPISCYVSFKGSENDLLLTCDPLSVSPGWRATFGGRGRRRLAGRWLGRPRLCWWVWRAGVMDVVGGSDVGVGKVRYMGGRRREMYWI